MENESVFEFTIPDELYQEASIILAERGTTVEEVAEQFIRYVATYGKLPFEIRKGVDHEGFEAGQLQAAMEAVD